jgi:CTP-dependent riboflavin kinase
MAGMAAVVIENRALVTDLLEWVAKAPRSYEDLMEAWRTSCPRLQVWEEATDLGLIVRQWSREAGATVSITDKGRDFLTGKD